MQPTGVDQVLTQPRVTYVACFGAGLVFLSTEFSGVNIGYRNGGRPCDIQTGAFSACHMQNLKRLPGLSVSRAQRVGCGGRSMLYACLWEARRNYSRRTRQYARND